MEKLDAQTVGIKGEKANSALIKDAPAEMQAFFIDVKPLLGPICCG